ncbi:hypothetical protein [Pulveribacter sp.]|uniref:hypothetical protein n=1 Tax=Pulveribacter sp. TaxID=2678893 RepID=UPI0028A97B06|nr:hypothetical protein [Pulveribacter sp.]
MDTLHPTIAASLAAFAPPTRWPEHIHGAIAPADYLSAGDIRARLEDRNTAAAAKVSAAITAISPVDMTPALLADVAQALLAQCKHLSRDVRETAKGYLTDLAGDMRHFAEQDA